MSAAKCPHCEALISTVTVLTVDIKDGRRIWPGGAYACPRCNSIISVGFDPIKVIDETVNRLLKKLR